MKKTMVLTALMVLALGMTFVDYAVADEAQNVAVAMRNLEEIWNEQDLSVIDEIISDTYIRHMPDGSKVRGREGYREHVKSFITPFPDLHVITHILIAKGDYVVAYDLGTATHTGPGMGTPTGKKINTSALLIHRFAAGKMVECWLEVNVLQFMQQLGYKLVPPSE